MILTMVIFSSIFYRIVFNILPVCLTAKALLSDEMKDDLAWVKYWIVYSLLFALEIILDLQNYNIPNYYMAKLILLAMCIASLEKRTFATVEDLIMKVKIYIFDLNSFRLLFQVSQDNNQNKDEQSAVSKRYNFVSQIETKESTVEIYPGAKEKNLMESKEENLKFIKIGTNKIAKVLGNGFLNAIEENMTERQSEHTEVETLRKELLKAKDEISRLKTRIKNSEKSKGNAYVRNQAYQESTLAKYKKKKGREENYYSNETNFIIKQVLHSSRESVFTIQFVNFKKQEIILVDIFIYIVHYWMVNIL